MGNKVCFYGAGLTGAPALLEAKVDSMSRTVPCRPGRGDRPDGLDKANAAIALDPENGEALLQQGRAYKNLGKTAKAIASFEASLKYYNYLPTPW
jgi:tetratricopeptide (TPR) repeat protein